MVESLLFSLSTWRPGPLVEVVGVETRVEWEAVWLLLLCRVIITIRLW